mmetsp:Transcript_11865/g.35634  ORF Transcript_11865/g.35634 Transcript_11865/m.35634 type:complete len:346 (+) Transcript_11865:139-1176(+)
MGGRFMGKRRALLRRRRRRRTARPAATRRRRGGRGPGIDGRRAPSPPSSEETVVARTSLGGGAAGGAPTTPGRRRRRLQRGRLAIEGREAPAPSKEEKEHETRLRVFLRLRGAVGLRQSRRARHRLRLTRRHHRRRVRRDLGGGTRRSPRHHGLRRRLFESTRRRRRVHGVQERRHPLVFGRPSRKIFARLRAVAVGQALHLGSEGGRDDQRSQAHPRAPRFDRENGLDGKTDFANDRQGLHRTDPSESPFGHPGLARLPLGGRPPRTRLQRPQSALGRSGTRRALERPPRHPQRTSGGPQHPALQPPLLPPRTHRHLAHRRRNRRHHPLLPRRPRPPAPLTGVT